MLAKYIEPGETLLDPMAGTGKIHVFHPLYDTIGVELEPEWARMHSRTICGDSRFLLSALRRHGREGKVAAIFTSAAYANRMADQYMGDPKGSRRHTYAIYLGRKLSPGNGGALQWGDDYKLLHAQIAIEMVHALASGGVLLLNMSNHIRKGKEQDVCAWWCGVLQELGLTLVEEVPVGTPRNRQGANHELRVEHEMLYVFLKG